MTGWVERVVVAAMIADIAREEVARAKSEGDALIRSTERRAAEVDLGDGPALIGHVSRTKATPAEIRAEVTDPHAYVEWVAGHYPDEVESVVAARLTKEIAARVQAGEVDWPSMDGEALPLPPGWGWVEYPARPGTMRVEPTRDRAVRARVADVVWGRADRLAVGGAS